MSELNENEIPGGLPLEEMRRQILPKNILQHKGSLYTFNGEKVVENEIDISSSPQAVFWNSRYNNFEARKISNNDIPESVIGPDHLSYTIPEECSEKKDNECTIKLSKNTKDQKLEISPEFDLDSFLTKYVKNKAEISIDKNGQSLVIGKGSLNNSSPCLIVKNITTTEEGQRTSLYVDLEVAEWGIGTDPSVWDCLGYQFDIYKKQEDGKYSSFPDETSYWEGIGAKNIPHVKITDWKTGSSIDIKVNMEKTKYDDVQSITVFYYNNN